MERKCQRCNKAFTQYSVMRQHCYECVPADAAERKQIKREIKNKKEEKKPDAYAVQLIKEVMAKAKGQKAFRVRR